MATRLYLHHAVSGVTGTLPSTEQSAQTAALNYESQATNRSMNTTIGTSQNQLDFTNSTVRSDAFGYVTKFVSANLNQTSIAANTWLYNYAAKCSAGGPINAYPTPSTNDRVPVCCYVWRPSTGAKVANIFDGNASATYWDLGFENITVETLQNGNFAGAAVTTQVNDVIVLEIWVRVDAVSTTSAVLSIMYDGTTVNTSATNPTSVTNHASFLETPENLAFVAGGAPIDMTESAAKTYSNKFITKV